MIIGTYAVGAQEGIVYVRAEYTLAVKRLRHAIRQAGEAGILGDSVLGTDFRFRVHLVRRGQGLSSAARKPLSYPP